MNVTFRQYSGVGALGADPASPAPAYQPPPEAVDPSRYIASPALRDAVNVALALGLPLLLTGEPGVGKSQLAASLAFELGLESPLVFHTKTDSVARDLFYRYDSLRHFHTIGGDLTVGAGVKVGVIDSGVDKSHPDLIVAGGLGCVPGSPENQFGPSGSHGTHVAGIIAGRGAAPTGVRGIAPGASIFSYRVFDDTANSGSSFAIVKAIRRGIADGCDLLNMSLGFDQDNGPPVVDDAIKDAIAEANAAGMVVIVAVGNDGRKPVSYPAMDDLAIAVSAIGRKGTFPTKSSESGDVAAPFGTDSKNFLAAFSNVGTALDVAGAGVGVVSTVPGGKHAPMSGTSMACPAVTGVLARLLANSPAVLNMARDANRADAIKALLFAQAQSLGLGVTNEGKGLPQ